MGPDADLWEALGRFLSHRPKGSKFFVKWTKGHPDEEDIKKYGLTPTEILGNDLADTFAKKGRDLCLLSSADQKRIDEMGDWAWRVLTRLVSTAMQAAESDPVDSDKLIKEKRRGPSENKIKLDNAIRETNHTIIDHKSIMYFTTCETRAAGKHRIAWLGTPCKKCLVPLTLLIPWA